MYNLRARFPFSFFSLCTGAVGVLLVSYIGLIAVVMSYAALTVEFSQSVKQDEAVVAVLENQYLASVARITSTDYLTQGYTKPTAQIFIAAQSVTALR